MWAERTKELIGLMMVGDGALTALEPERHMRLWQEGPWERLVEPFLRRPQTTRLLGILTLAAGLWLASRQDVHPPRLRRVRRLAHRSLRTGRSREWQRGGIRGRQWLHG